MSDDSFQPSSDNDGLGVTWCLSQQHQLIYDERKQRRRLDDSERPEEKENLKRPKLESDPFVKQEPSSPCVTPRPTALKANKKFTEYVLINCCDSFADLKISDNLLERSILKWGTIHTSKIL